MATTTITLTSDGKTNDTTRASRRVFFWFSTSTPNYSTLITNLNNGARITNVQITTSFRVDISKTTSTTHTTFIGGGWANPTGNWEKLSGTNAPCYYNYTDSASSCITTSNAGNIIKPALATLAGTTFTHSANGNVSRTWSVPASSFSSLGNTMSNWKNGISVGVFGTSSYEINWGWSIGMTLVITLEIGTTIRYCDNGTWKNCNVYYCDNGTWKQCDVKYCDNSTWKGLG